MEDNEQKSIEQLFVISRELALRAKKVKQPITVKDCLTLAVSVQKNMVLDDLSIDVKRILELVENELNIPQ